MKNLPTAVFLLALTTGFIAFPAAAENTAATETKTVAENAKSADTATKKADAKKSPYLLQQPKQQQNNKHKSEKMFEKKTDEKKAG